MKTAIVVDSSCGLDEKFANERNIFFLKYHVFLEGKEYILNKNITREEFIHKVKSSTQYPTTAVPSLDEIREVILDLRAQGFFRFVFLISNRKLTRFYTLCEDLINADEYLKKNSLLVEMDIIAMTGMIPVLLLKKDLDKLSFRNINLFINNLLDNSSLYFSPYDLTYAVKGGRVKPIQGFFGKTFNIFPIFSGESVPTIVGKGVGVKNTVVKILDYITHFIQGSNFYYAVVSSSSESEHIANQLASLIYERFHGRAEFIHHSKPNLQMISHLGPDFFGVGVIRKA